MMRLAATFLPGLGAALLAAAVIGPASPAAASPLGLGEAVRTPSHYEDVRTRAIDAYVPRRCLRARTEAARSARQRLADFPPGFRAVVPITGTAVEGKIEVPVIALRFADTPAPPYDVAQLQRQLFDGQSGTMTEHYKEMSRGKLTVTGRVLDWTPLPGTEASYAGPAGCNGRCLGAKIGDMLNQTLAKIDAGVDFRAYDNDGPDRQPNSGDDDGYVDFVAFVHPSRGGECGAEGNQSIWSHRFAIQSWTGQAFETGDVSVGGTRIRVNDYVIMPALACDGRTMIQIGVFSHEFGHAFGLPDLYDSRDPVESFGLGGWDLMAAGSWGGDGHSKPDSPVHMGSWAKEYLGWVAPRVITTDTPDVRIEPVTRSGQPVRVDYASAADPEDTRYLLLEYRTQDGFDRSLMGGGLLVTEVNNTVVQAGQVNNSVNGSPFDMGVNVIEADGKRDLDNGQNRADEGDVFPGAANVANLDTSHAEKIRAALCNIRQTPEAITLDIYTSRTTCPEVIAQAAVSPEAAKTAALPGQEIVVEGVLVNQGTNYFTDRKLVVKGLDGGEIAVTAPLPLEAAPRAGDGAPLANRGGTRSVQPPDSLSDVLDKKVIVRGHLKGDPQKGTGGGGVLVIEEFKLAK